MVVRQRLTPRVPGARPPHVAVVVPCYNYGHYLPQCISSILAQSDVSLDVLIIDDASPDDSGAVAEKIAARHDQVRAIRHESNQGHVATYNEGLAMADSDYVVLLSADDLLTPGALSRATALMDANPTVGLVYGNPVSFIDHPPVAAKAVRSWSIWSGPDWIRAQVRRGLSIIYSPEAVVRTSIQHRVGYYLPELPHSGDLEMWLRIAAIADVGRVNGADQAFRRVHPDSMMQAMYGTVIKDLTGRSEAYEIFFATSGKNLGNAGKLATVACRSMCQEALDWACTVLAAQPAGELDDRVSADVEQCVEFAQRIYPSYSSLLAWREYRRRVRNGGVDGIYSRLISGFHSVRRDFTGRVKWQRWYRFGT